MTLSEVAQIQLNPLHTISPSRFGPIVDLRRWLQTYAFWSGGGAGNVAKMLRFLENNACRYIPFKQKTFDLFDLSSYISNYSLV